jgi:hypothetical protein
MSSSMTETASQPDVTPLQPETGFSSSRDRVGIHRAQEYGLLPRRLLVSRNQLDKLAERGYLDPDDHLAADGGDNSSVITMSYGKASQREA